MQQNKPKDPNWVTTFSMKRNPDKTPGDSKPDLISVDSDKINQKTGKPYRKNFTIKMDGQDVWCEPAAWIQEDKSIKITLKKSVSTGTAKPAADPWETETVPY